MISNNSLNDIKNSIDTGNNEKNLQQFKFQLNYNFVEDLGNIGLRCLTGEKNNIIAKFEFYVHSHNEVPLGTKINTRMFL